MPSFKTRSMFSSATGLAAWTIRLANRSSFTRWRALRIIDVQIAALNKLTEAQRRSKEIAGDPVAKDELQTIIKVRLDAHAMLQPA